MTVIFQATHPIDTLKVKAQVGGNINYKTTLQSLLQNGQSMSLFWGLEAALLRSVTYGSFRYAFYSPIKRIFGNSGDDAPASFMTKVLSGCFAGCMASAVCNPTDLIKVRMQTGNHIGYGTISSATKSIVHNHGIKGLWMGTGPTCARATVLAAAELSTYDQAKESLLEMGYFNDGVALHFVASTVAGFVSAAVSNPFDFAKSRIMNQNLDAQGRGLEYNGTFDCMLKSVRREGTMVLWSGEKILALYTFRSEC